MQNESVGSPRKQILCRLGPEVSAIRPNPSVHPAREAETVRSDVGLRSQPPGAQISVCNTPQALRPRFSVRWCAIFRPQGLGGQNRREKSTVFREAAR